MCGRPFFIIFRFRKCNQYGEENDNFAGDGNQSDSATEEVKDISQ